MSDTIFSNGTVITSSWLNDTNDIIYGFVENITALKQLDSKRFTRAKTLGYYSKGDGGSGEYYLDPTDTVSLDNGGTIIISNDGGVWKLLLTEYANVKQFGAKADGITDDSSSIQAAINLGKPFRLTPGAIHLCKSTLNWKPGAVMLGTEPAALNESGGTTGATIIQFDESATSTGIELNWETGFLTSWGIEGVAFQTTNLTNGRVAFRCFHVSNVGSGVYNFWLRDISILGVQYGIYQEDNLFAGEIKNFHVISSYKTWHQTAGNITSMEIGFLKSSYCFYGLELSNVVYSNIDAYFDHCGLTVPFLAEMPTTEMPVLQKFTNSTGVRGTIGQEESNAIFMWETGYCSIEQTAHYYSAATNLWQKSTTRISNIPEASQALIVLENSTYKLRGVTFSAPTTNGYPAASTTDPSYFCRLVAGSDTPLFTLENCFLNLPSFCICPSTSINYLVFPDYLNRKSTFGAINITNLNNFFGFENGRLRVGTSTAQDYMQLQRVATFVEGDEALRVTGASGAANVRFFAVNGSGGNVANAGLKVAAASSNSRAINAGGTVNASGSDYAEYMKKENTSDIFLKGDIVGITSGGLLTKSFSRSVAFLVKSTNPSYVGGDTWASSLTDLKENASEEEKEAFKNVLEQLRQSVDRIAFTGQVPINVLGACPGDYIVPTNSNDSIVGIAVSSPSLEQYFLSLGKVISIEQDGRARIIVKSC